MLSGSFAAEHITIVSLSATIVTGPMDLMDSIPVVAAFGGIPAAAGTVDPGRLKVAR